MRKIGANPFQLDSPRPTITLKDYAYNETRYSSLADTDARTAVDLPDAALRWVDARLLAMGPQQATKKLPCLPPYSGSNP